MTGQRSNPDGTVTSYDAVLRVSPMVWLGHQGVREAWYSGPTSPHADLGVTVRLYDAGQRRWVSRWEDPARWTPIIWPETASLVVSPDSVFLPSTAYSDLTGDHRQTLRVTGDHTGWSFIGRRQYPGADPFVWESFEARPLEESGPASLDGSGPASAKGTVRTLLEGFSGSRAVAVDDDGFVWLAARLPGDEGDDVPLRRIGPDGRIDRTVRGLRPTGLAWAAGSLWAKHTDGEATRLVRIGADGLPSTVAEVAGDPLAVDPEGNAYTNPPGDDRILRTTPDGRTDVYAEHPELVGALGMAWDPATGLLYVGKFTDGQIEVVHPDGTVEDLLTVPGLGAGSVAWMAWADGHLYLTSFTSQLVLRVDPETRSVEWVAGDGMPGGRDGSPATSRFFRPNGIGVTADGQRIYVAELRRLAGGVYPEGRLRVIELAGEEEAPGR